MHSLALLGKSLRLPTQPRCSWNPFSAVVSVCVDGPNQGPTVRMTVLGFTFVRPLQDQPAACPHPSRHPRRRARPTAFCVDGRLDDPGLCARCNLTLLSLEPPSCRASFGKVPSAS